MTATAAPPRVPWYQLVAEDCRRVLEPKRRQTVSEWADANRHLTAITSAIPGPWRTSHTPYLRELMDAISDPLCRRITFVKPTQVGGSEAEFNMLGWVIEHAPAPTLVVYPRETDAFDISVNRIMPMLRASPSLRRFIPRKADDFSAFKYLLENGPDDPRMVVYFAYAGSPADLASKAVRFVFLDEVDKYPLAAGREADPVSLAMERTRTFSGRECIVEASTPTTRHRHIWKSYEKSDRRRYHVPCPHCGAFQPLTWANVKWPPGVRDPEQIDREGLAWIECLSCGGEMRERHKRKMLAGGVWVPEGGEVAADGSVVGVRTDGRHRGYWLNALYSVSRTWSDMAREFLQAQGDQEALQNFMNSGLAEVWEDLAVKTSDSKIKGRAAGYPQSFCPAGVQVLTAGVDVQADRMYAVIRGWGFGEESWLIRAVVVHRWPELKAVLLDTAYKSASGDALSVRLACVDAGHRGDEVYEFVRKTSRERVRATRGSSHDMGGIPCRMSKLERGRGGKAHRAGAELWWLNTTFFKDKLFRHVEAGPDALGRWHVFEGVPDEYVKQLAAEHKVITRHKRTNQVRATWVNKGRAGNHFLDCEVYATAAAHMLGVHALRVHGAPEVSNPGTRAPRDGVGGGWLTGGGDFGRGDRGSWLTP